MARAGDACDSTRPPVTTVHKGRVHLDPSLKGQDRAATRVEGGIILQNARSRFDRTWEFFDAIKHGREPNASVAKVLPCYRVLNQLECQLS